MNIAVANYLRSLAAFSHDVRMYLIVSALIGLSYIGFLSVLLNLYLLRRGYGPEFIGIVNASTALAFAFSSLPAGAIGGRFGSRRVVIAGVTLVSVGIVLMPLAERLPLTWQTTGVIMARLISGLGFALYIVNANPVLMAITQPQQRDLVFALQVALPPFAGFVGSLIGGLLPGFFAAILGLSMDDPAPFRPPLYIAAALILPGVYAIISTQEYGRRTGLMGGSALASNINLGYGAAMTPYSLILVLAVVSYFRMAGEGVARSFFNVYLDTTMGIPTAQIGLLTAVGQILAAPAALVTPLIVMRQGKLATVVGSTVGIAGSLLLMALVPHWTSAGLGFMGVIGMLTVTRAVINVYQMEIVSEEWRAAMSGTTSMAMGLGFSSMALGGGYLVGSLGFRGLFLIGAGMVFTSALLFWGYFRVPRGEFARISSSPHP